ncbi:SMI1/KNR4 family protein [Oceanirhabdus sp. W0125-5]|uniref:SMI1/KNR4 family protein n=1 Tax=Oceanirhabdus sp. W0125-5 TaxID=2999116 RepID=UPI0022F2C8D6|nr:SMI1/KNR4 family protein [Oceanirhabdus sp. W0125-5]WBW96117.1 SMI1/KNR4 family protein [Oceanirhabdus sp. W0125-5]
MEIKDLIKKIEKLSDCKVYPPEGLPKIDSKHKLPKDVEEFYTICGGISLFESKPYSLKIVRPEEVSLANPVLIDKEIIDSEMEKGTYDSEISTDWYIIVDLYDSNYIVIDFNQDRLGRCYQAFWDTYPSMGDTPIVAKSFKELLRCLIVNNGEYWYFLEDSFEQIGDAYDDINL